VILRLILLIALSVFASPARAQVKNIESNRLYKGGLDAYLAGNYDRAILLAAKAAQADPQSKKAQDLLSVLVAEKEKIARTEIWISNPKQASKQPKRIDIKFLWAELVIIRKEIKAIKAMKAGRAPINGENLLPQFERQVQVIAALLDRSSTAQMTEMKTAQDQVYRALGVTQTVGLRMAMILFGLCLVSLILSVAAFLRRERPKREAESYQVPR
jgi:hypothetical protein